MDLASETSSANHRKIDLERAGSNSPERAAREPSPRLLGRSGKDSMSRSFRSSSSVMQQVVHTDKEVSNCGGASPLPTTDSDAWGLSSLMERVWSRGERRSMTS